VCGTKNFVSVRLYSAPQSHWTIVAILRICAYGRSDQAGFGRHKRGKPLCRALSCEQFILSAVLPCGVVRLCEARGHNMASADHFEQELLGQMERAASRGAKHIVINSAELQCALGDFPRPDQQSPSCCDVMEREMKSGDVLLVDRSRQSRPDNPVSTAPLALKVGS
jgi:hypothetical protein